MSHSLEPSLKAVFAGVDLSALEIGHSSKKCTIILLVPFLPFRSDTRNGVSQISILKMVGDFECLLVFLLLLRETKSMSPDSFAE